MMYLLLRDDLSLNMRSLLFWSGPLYRGLLFGCWWAFCSYFVLETGKHPSLLNEFSMVGVWPFRWSWWYSQQYRNHGCVVWFKPWCSPQINLWQEPINIELLSTILYVMYVNVIVCTIHIKLQYPYIPFSIISSLQRAQ